MFKTNGRMSFSGKGSVTSMALDKDGDMWFHMSGIDNAVYVNNAKLRRILIENVGSCRGLTIEGYATNGKLHVTSIA